MLSHWHMVPRSCGCSPTAEENWDELLTPVNVAAMEGHSAIVEMLAEAGAALNITDTVHGRTPVYNAAYGGHWATVEVLCRYGAELDISESMLGCTPLYTAADKGRYYFLGLYKYYCAWNRRGSAHFRFPHPFPQSYAYVGTTDHVAHFLPDSGSRQATWRRRSCCCRAAPHSTGALLEATAPRLST